MALIEPHLGVTSLEVINIIKTVLGYEAEDLDLDQSFTQLGGTSFSALSVSSTCLQNNIALPVPSVLLSNSISGLLEHAMPIHPKHDQATKRALECLDENAGREPAFQPAIASSACSSTGPRTVGSSQKRLKTRMNVTNEVVLTEMQLSFVAGSLRTPGLNIIKFYDTYPSKYITILKRAWKLVVLTDRLYPLEAANERGEIKTWVSACNPFDWKEVYVKDDTAYGFELKQPCNYPQIPSSFRVVTKLRDGVPDISTIVWHVHHALIDGYSASLVYNKVHRTASGLHIEASPLFQTASAESNHIRLSQSDFYRKHWKRMLCKYPYTTSEIQFPQSIHIAYEHAEFGTCLPLELPNDKLVAFARKIGVTVAAVHYGIWALVLSKMTDSDSVVFGAVVPGRSSLSSSTRNAIGPMINTLPFFVSTAALDYPPEYLTRVFQDMVELDSVQPSNPSDGFNRNFSSAIALEPDLHVPTFTKLQPLNNPSFEVSTDIPINILVGSDGGAKFVYHRTKYSVEEAKLITEYYTGFANSLLGSLQPMKHSLRNLVPESTLDKLLAMGNAFPDKTRDLEASEDLVTLFEAMSISTPNSIALEKGEAQLKYAELNRLASRIAGQLITRIVPGDVVFVHADRSINFIIAIYAILKAHGVYAPLDPALPASTRDSYCKIAGGRVFIAPQDSGLAAKPLTCSLSLSVENLLNNGTSLSMLPYRKSANANVNAYVCFTSGSTGHPKAVLCHHRGLVAFQMDEHVRLHAKPGYKISQVMSPAFDGSIHEIFSALSYGATLILPARESGLEHISKAQCAVLTPSLGKVLKPEDLPMLEYVYFVGECVPQSVNDDWTASKTVYNMYGPTETTCGATIKQLHHGMLVTIGRPTPFCRVYILDRHRALSPPGCVGDIYIAGTQVSNGYVGQATETARCFVTDTVYGVDNQTMYHTGDRGFWNTNGEIQFIGRSDRQIKLNGFRLDLNALEGSIAKALPETRAVALVRKEDYLVAAVQPSHLNQTSLKFKLTASIPPYAMPRYILSMDSFPMTSAGKLDYKAIASCHTSGDADHPVTSLTEIESKIAEVWRDILKLEDIVLAPCSNFCVLGGHSLAQLTLAGRLSHMFHRNVPVQIIIRNPDLRDLAIAIKGLVLSRNLRSLSVGKSDVLGSSSVSPIEAEWWQKYQLGGDTSSFNVVLLYQLNPDTVNRQKLGRAWNKTLERHKVLRSRYSKGANGPQREYHDSPPRVQRVRHLNVRQQMNRPFRLDCDHLFRVYILQRKLLICASHIICDLTTMKILMDEVAAIYTGRSLSPITRCYSDVRHWSSELDPNDLAYWSCLFSDSPTKTFILKHSKPCSRKAYSGTSHAIRLSPTLSKLLSDYVTAHDSTYHQLALAAVSLACSPTAERIGITIGSPYLNRRPEDMAAVGLFVEPLPIRVQHAYTSTSERVGTLLRSVKRSSQSALAHVVPWNSLVKHLLVEVERPNQALFDVMVTFHDDRNGDMVQLPGVHRQLVWTDGAKFPLLCEFTALADDKMILRVEYDYEIYDSAQICTLEATIMAALDLLVSNATFQETAERLESINQSGAEGTGHELDEIAFGTCINDI